MSLIAVSEATAEALSSSLRPNRKQILKDIGSVPLADMRRSSAGLVCGTRLRR